MPKEKYNDVLRIMSMFMLSNIQGEWKVCYGKLWVLNNIFIPAVCFFENCIYVSLCFERFKILTGS